jgi:hypothetical protein
MTTTLQEIEETIGRCRRLEHVTYRDPALDGTPRPETPVRSAIEGLYRCWRALRTTLWSDPYREWARRLEGECRAGLEAISAEHGLRLDVREPDRWPATATAPAVH